MSRDEDIQTDFAAVLAHIRSARYRLACVDFGGTLVDFLPLHIRGFLDALDLPSDGGDARLVERAVGIAVDLGLDSFEMMQRVADALTLPSNKDLASVVVKKRGLIEEYLRTTTLSVDAHSYLLQLMDICSVTVISLGLVRSMRAVLAKALEDKAARVAVFGRHSLTERVDKATLLRRAIEGSRVPKEL